jgi:hypothetical protein
MVSGRYREVRYSDEDIRNTYDRQIEGEPPPKFWEDGTSGDVALEIRLDRLLH